MRPVFRENAARLGQLIAQKVGSGNLPVTSEQVWDIVEKYQVRVDIVPAGDRNANPKVRAIYDCRRKLIVIEEASLASLKLACEADGYSPVSRADVLAMHIAHELYHHLEESGHVPLSEYYRCGGQSAENKVFPLFTWQFVSKPPLAVLREIAAHAFVITLLGLAISPELLAGRSEGRDALSIQISQNERQRQSNFMMIGDAF